jgi:lipopolysaccharide export system permease protein
MLLINKYLNKTILSAILIITLLLSSIEIFILFINQFSDIGKGNYTIWQALRFVMQEMPYEVYLFLPMSCLLGTMSGLGLLANNHELIIMRSSGMSIWQISKTILKSTIVIIAIMFLIGEFILPKILYQAAKQKIHSLSQQTTINTDEGMWVNYEKLKFIHIGNITSDNLLLNINEFHFNKDHELVLVRHSDKIVYEDNLWQSFNVYETKLDKDKPAIIRSYDKSIWDIALHPSILGISTRQADEMQLNELYKYIQNKNQNTENYELVFWQRLMQPLSSIVMILLAIPFIFGPLREAPIGLRILTGAGIGFGFYILNHILGSISQVYQIAPILGAITPTCIFTIIAIYLSAYSFR